MMKLEFIRGIISSTVAAAGKLLRIDCSGRYSETVSDREAIQQYGLQSRPPAGTECVLLRQGHVLIMVASDGREYRLELLDGEIVVGTASSARVRIQGDTVLVEADTLRVSASAIELGDTAGIKRLITEDILSALPLHTHAGVTVGGGITGTATFAPPLSTALHATSKTKAE